jgi:hypothetical protein
VCYASSFKDGHIKASVKDISHKALSLGDYLLVSRMLFKDLKLDSTPL